MTDTIHIMLDLETWGKRPGCDLRSIGACVFAPVARHGGSLVHDGSLGTIKPFYVATDNPGLPCRSCNERRSCLVGGKPCTDCDGHGYYTDDRRKYPLRRDPETVGWWSEQSDEAQGAFANPVDLRTALEQFTQWLSLITGQLPFNVDGKWRGIDCCLWSHGPAFDVSILAAAYEACGLPIPWHYRAPRDTRTCFDMANVGDHSAWLQRFPVGTFHHALDDAISQAQAVCAAVALTWEAPARVRQLEHAIKFAMFQLRDGQCDCVHYNLGVALGEYTKRPTGNADEWGGHRVSSLIDAYDKTYCGGMSPGLRPSIERFARWLDTGNPDAPQPVSLEEPK